MLEKDTSIINHGMHNVYHIWIGTLLILFCSSTFSYVVPKFKKEQALKKLSPLQKKVILGSGTEPAFHNKYWQNKQEGIYVDLIT